MPVNWTTIGGGIRGGSGKLMAAGGGRPLCGVLIFSGGATGSGRRRSRSAFGENRFDGDDGWTNS